jgi:hypothetical protein
MSTFLGSYHIGSLRRFVYHYMKYQFYIRCLQIWQFWVVFSLLPQSLCLHSSLLAVILHAFKYLNVSFYSGSMLEQFKNEYEAPIFESFDKVKSLVEGAANRKGNHCPSFYMKCHLLGDYDLFILVLYFDKFLKGTLRLHGYLFSF